MASKKIVVVGSANTDMVIVTEHFPVPGETILGGKFLMNAGGKGANQAVAAARGGGNVAFIAKVGNDVFGQQTIQNLLQEGIDVSGVKTDKDYPSGVAMITVDKRGENCIVVAPGSNMRLTPADIDSSSLLLDKAEILLLQLEIPLATVTYAAKKAFSLGAKVILNPAPAHQLPEELFPCLYIITPNENEIELLTGIKVTNEATALKAASLLKEKGVSIVIITLGASGAFIFSDTMQMLVPSPKVEAVDSTSAGDTFNGALAVALAEGKDILAAVQFANKAAAMTVMKLGAQASIPTVEEILSKIF